MLQTNSVVVQGMVIKNSNVGEYDKRVVLLTKERGKIVAFARGARRVKSPLLAGTRLFAFGEFTLFEGKEAYTLEKAEIENYFTEIANDMEATCYGCYFLELADYYTRENLEAWEQVKLLYVTLRALMKPAIPNRLVKCIYELKCMTIHGEYPQMFSCVSCGTQAVGTSEAESGSLQSGDVKAESGSLQSGDARAESMPRKADAVRKESRPKGSSIFSVEKGGMLCDRCAGQARDALSLHTSTIYAMQYIISGKMEKLYTFVLKEENLLELETVMKRCFARTIDREFNSLKILNTILK